MDALYKRWKHIPKQVRKPLVFIVGFAIIFTGVAMLVLPGPGWAAIFIGLAVLATEFALAAKVRDWLILEVKKRYKHTKKISKAFFKRRKKLRKERREARQAERKEQDTDKDIRKS